MQFTHPPAHPTPMPRYLSDPLLPFLGEFRGAGVHLAGIERPLRALPGGKGEHGQGGCQKSECTSLNNGQPGGGGSMQLPTRSFSTGPNWGLLIQVLAV